LVRRWTWVSGTHSSSSIFSKSPNWITPAPLTAAALTAGAAAAASTAGAALGFAFARWGSRLLVAQLSTWYATAFLDLTPDWRVLAVTGGMTVATVLPSRGAARHRYESPRENA